ncbi:hypothetical protein [Bathymodiolus japonicus methanotrophic gill symbiont]|nr:hypothetical protein [Bathymodiolus japonicus methanotrophic gill symbiont]
MNKLGAVANGTYQQRRVLLNDNRGLEIITSLRLRFPDFQRRK